MVWFSMSFLFKALVFFVTDYTVFLMTEAYICDQLVQSYYLIVITFSFSRINMTF